ncbi:hypothetical protein A0H81_07224 [Grifola frondosa]|uniref:Uncharacterized protein n=1 Tax=Grifola frondosa TaxID=5627 RepID=A0A1C7M8R7_GRIFR|nr:hypothetical protein A0H81_07224 [Grifola frondosa]
MGRIASPYFPPGVKWVFFVTIFSYVFQTQGDSWFKPSEENVHAGVVFEWTLSDEPVVAVKIRSAAIHAALASVKPDANAIFVDENTRIQILDSMMCLPTADKEQCGAFLRDEWVLVVWSYNLDDIIPTCQDFDEKLIKLVWNRRFSYISNSPLASSAPSDLNLTEKIKEIVDSKEVEVPLAKTRVKKKKNRHCGLGYWITFKDDVEKTAEGPSERPVRLFAPFYNGFGVALSIFFIGSGISIILQEALLDDHWVRFALLVTAPFLICVSLFFSLQIVTNVSYVLGPVAQYHENSKYFSAVPPAPNKIVDANLPHVSIEIPVYTESLTATIAPSRAIALLASHSTRDHNIGWVARPRHSKDPAGYKRAGRFKKASNMNYGLALSLRLEKHLLALEADGAMDTEDEYLEDRALKMAIDDIYEESGKKWKPWANNGKSLRIGDLILIVDADTIVPEDCLRDAARELSESPEVAIIQHESDVMQVAHHYFENGIAHFTRRINKCISMGCANGEDAAFVDPADGVKKIWSESNVSEDFDMALRLQLQGYIIRWAAYSDRGFKEGVSLTCDDELSRWEKYAYGCNELIFNPLIDWWHMGPITKQLRVFMWSDAPVHYKISMMSYMFSTVRYTTENLTMLSLLNYCLLGWNFGVDGFYEHSFEIWLACTVVFPGAGNLGFTLLEYRLGLRDLLEALVENLTWVPFFMHLTQALLAHLFSYDISWGTTKKEVERSNFWIEVPRILKRFWIILLICLALSGGMIVLSTSLIPVGWQINSWDWAVILPLALVVGCHALFPVVLNPWLMIFSY